MEHVADIARDRRIENNDEDAYIAAIQAYSVEHRTAPSGHVSAPKASVKLRVSENTVSALAHEGFLKEFSQTKRLRWRSTRNLNYSDLGTGICLSVNFPDLPKNWPAE
ncbi:hypothetical protein [Sinorhizobium fredii]|nr:hypothetical protein [Sinorhizobium fredii]